jgi:ubiquinone/menaquinone biosynthesis C-methylase UbiE
MSQKDDFQNSVLQFWNSRAGLNKWAGTNDTIAKQLEIETIANYAHDGLRILDFGCGNGITAMELARRYDVRVLGIDYAEEMINAANDLANNQNFKGSIQFQVGDIRSLAQISEKFDLVYTERTLINLPDWSAQRDAIIALGSLLANDGVYVMCENSQDGLDQINALRERIGCTKITAPWHNHYLKDADIQKSSFPGLKLEAINYYSSTYYFLSRVVNAYLAQQDGKEPEYESPVNQLALQLPAIGELGQGRIWLWRKASGAI